MVSVCRVLAGAIVVMLLAASATAGTSTTASGEQPLQIKSVSLGQDGQDLVWKVVMAQPFSPGALASDDRSLCLLLERQANGSVAGQLCLTGGPKAARLEYMSVTAAGAGPGRVIPATVTRTSSSELSAAFLPSAAALAYRPMRWQVLSDLGSPPCPPGSACTAVSPAEPALLALHTPELVGCTARGPAWVFNGPTNVHEVALTFDDGPWDEPPSVEFVDLLAREHVPATFFEIGDQISRYDPHGSVERKMLADGDMIGDHTWSHPDLTMLSSSAQRAQLAGAAAAIRKATGFEPCLFRAPYGAVNPGVLAVARSLGMATIQWNVDPRDWALPGVGAIYANVVSNAHNGAIVIQHFGGGPRYETLAALPEEIGALRARGYRFVTVTQMLGYKLIYK